MSRIKGMQRSDNNAKQAWWDYCDAQLSGVRDPAKHSAMTLQGFMDAYEQGYTVAAPAAVAKPTRRPATGGVQAWVPPSTFGAAPPSMGGRGSFVPVVPQVQQVQVAGTSLSDFIKIGQKRSQGWKTAWQAYCQLYGNRFNDPAKYDESFIGDFMEFVGQLAAEALQQDAKAQGVPLDPAPAVGSKRSSTAMGTLGGPPAKRQALSRAAPEGDKAALVNKIKGLQRSDATIKEAWWAFCDAEKSGVRDPNRHDVATLEEFLGAYGGSA